MAEEIEIRDFSYVAINHPFKIGGDVFYALPDIPLGMVAKLAGMQNVAEAVQKQGAEQIVDIFCEFLEERSAEVFRARIDQKKIGVMKITEILPWLLEKYGLRPTQPSSDSSTSSDDGSTGTSSTDGAPLEASIP